MLIRVGLLTPDQLRAALVEQKQQKKRQHLGLYLVEQGLVTEQDIETWS